MTTTILNTGDYVSCDADAILALDVSKFVLVDTYAPDDNTREAVYQKVGGSKEYPLTIRIGAYFNPGAEEGVGRTNLSIKIASFAQNVQASDTIWTLPCHATLALSMPGKTGVPDAQDVEELIGSLFSMYIPIAAGVVQSTAALDELAYNVVGNALSHTNSNSV